jgi:hypothetical protein
LHLGGSRINDERAPNNDDGIAHLAGLANLEELYLGATEVLGHGLKQLATLEKLRLLDLSYCPLTDSALEELPRLAQLETLYLQGTGVDDYELPRLAELPRLKVLDVAVTRVTAEGLAALGLLESLRELGIGKSSVSPTGLESLRASKQLRSLHITGANQWNPGMVSLALDGGDEFNVDEAEELDFRRALESLRSQRRRVWIDSQVVPNPRGRERPGQRLVERPPPADRKRGPPWVGGVF